jgi:putative hydrolase of HD superfamily
MRFKAEGMSPRLTEQLTFISEVDKLKSVLRQTLLQNGSRAENSAEHSWHLAMMAVVLLEYAAPETDLKRTLEMLLVHDIVEVEAGDTFAYDTVAYRDKELREQAAAEKLFGLLPDEQARALRALWDEFEAQQTSEARFANALDRLQPFWHNLHTAGGTWRVHGITKAQVLKRMEPIAWGTPELWPVVQGLIEEAVAAGILAEG